MSDEIFEIFKNSRNRFCECETDHDLATAIQQLMTQNDKAKINHNILSFLICKRIFKFALKITELDILLLNLL